MKATLNGIILFVRNTGKLKSFYMDIFGLELVEEIPSEWVLLKAGACTLGLHRIGEAYLPASDTDFKADSNTKIVFEIEEDIFSQREILSEKKIKIGPVKTFDNYDYRLCDGEDPEGNVFQLKQKK